MLYEVAYSEGLSRWKTLLRLPLLVPVYLFDFLVQYLLWTALFIGWTTVSLRKKYPGWLFAAATGTLAFQARYHAYSQLLTDKFPSFDRETSPVLLKYDDPPNGSLSRWRVFVFKLILVFPHLALLTLLGMAVFVVTTLAWFAILFTGRYPRGLFGFVTGVNRWWYRVVGYFASFNDSFPPFALSASAGPGRGASPVVSGIAGLFLLGGSVAFITTAVVLSNQPDEATVDYAALKAGDAGAAYTALYGLGAEQPHAIRLLRVTDPDTSLATSLGTPATSRVIVFEVQIQRLAAGSDEIGRGFAGLDYDDGRSARSVGATLILAGGLPAPQELEGRSVPLRLIFVIPQGATPTHLTLHPPWAVKRLELNFR